MKIQGKTSKKHQRYPSPGPLARATLSRRERDLSQNNLKFRQQLTPAQVPEFCPDAAAAMGIGSAGPFASLSCDP